MISATLDDYLTRFGEVVNDTTLSGTADGGRISRARALAQINWARRGIQRELIQAGVTESRLAEKIALTVDSSDSYLYDLPRRVVKLICIVDADDNVYHSVYSRHRVGEVGYITEARSIRWFNVESPSVTLYAVAVREPVSLSRGTAAAVGAASITFAGTPNVGVNIEEDDYYNGCRIAIASGTGSLQVETISDYVASTRVATTGTWATALGADSVYSLMEDMPLCVMDAVVLRAAHNLSRFDPEFDHVIERLYAEYLHAFNSALSELMLPSGTSAPGPRIVEEYPG